ncbi:MAG: hypothetical protein ACJ72D_00260 [Marmoricola sp.]
MATDPSMTVLDRIAFVATLAWAIAFGALVPGAIAGVVFGRTLAVLATVAGGTVGYLIHRYAWSEPGVTRR